MTSFAEYGPKQIDIRCVFDDSSTLRAVSLLPMGDDDAESNITTVSLTPAEPVRTFRWFARSPFASGFGYRPYDGQGGAWTDGLAGPQLVLYSSQLRKQETAREASVTSIRGVRESVPHRPGHSTEVAAVAPRRRSSRSPPARRRSPRTNCCMSVSTTRRSRCSYPGM